MERPVSIHNSFSPLDMELVDFPVPRVQAELVLLHVATHNSVINSGGEKGMSRVALG